MKRLGLITGLSLVFCFAVDVSVHSQEWIINPANGHGYMISNEARQWDFSEEAAKSLGGHLVTINNQEENDWIVENILSMKSTNRLWIGLYVDNGEYKWLNGEDSSYFNWNFGEPDGGKYVFIYCNDYPAQKGQWADHTNPNAYYFSIIETFNPSPTPTPQIQVEIGKNLLKNPGAEDGLNGWNITNGHITQNSKYHVNGVYSFAFETPTGSRAEQTINLSLFSSEIDSGNVELKMGVYFSNGYLSIEITFLNENYNIIDEWENPENDRSSNTGPSGWKALNYEMVLPPQTRILILSLSVEPRNFPQYCYVDELSIEVNTLLPPTTVTYPYNYTYTYNYTNTDIYINPHSHTYSNNFFF